TLITPDVVLELDLDVQTPVRQERIASVPQVVSAPVVRLASVADRGAASHQCRSRRAAAACGTVCGWPTRGQGAASRTGTTEWANAVFRAHRYGPDHPALQGRDLNPDQYANINRLYAASR